MTYGRKNLVESIGTWSAKGKNVEHALITYCQPNDTWTR